MKYALALFLLLVGQAPCLANGRADWSGYDWRGQAFGTCIDQAGQACLVHHAKWDWKRNQWVDIWYDASGNGLEIEVRFTNNDRKDDDHVCVTVLFLDADGGNVAAHHVNEWVKPRTIEQRSVNLPMSSAIVQRIARVEIGTKQCREGAHQDDAVYAAVRDRLSH